MTAPYAFKGCLGLLNVGHPVLPISIMRLSLRRNTSKRCVIHSNQRSSKNWSISLPRRNAPITRTAATAIQRPAGARACSRVQHGIAAMLLPDLGQVFQEALRKCRAAPTGRPFDHRLTTFLGPDFGGVAKEASRESLASTNRPAIQVTRPGTPSVSSPRMYWLPRISKEPLGRHKICAPTPGRLLNRPYDCHPLISHGSIFKCSLG